MAITLRSFSLLELATVESLIFIVIGLYGEKKEWCLDPFGFK